MAGGKEMGRGESENSLEDSERRALAAVAQWVKCWPVNQKVIGLIPGQGTCLGGWPGSQWGSVRGNQSMYLSHISVSLPLFLPPVPLSKNK